MGTNLKVPPQLPPLLNTGKKQGSRFAAGESGNPAGRPRGARGRAAEAMRDLLAGDGEAIMRKAVNLAKAGDPVALRLCIDRLVPRAGRVVQVSLPKLQKAGDLADACAAVIEAAAEGRMSLGEAREFMELLDVHRRAMETFDLAVRIELLEAVEVKPSKGVRR